MQLGRLHHVGMVVPDCDVVSSFYRATLGAAAIGDPIVPADGSVRIRFVRTAGALVELLEPLTDDSDLAIFLRANPAGALHHLCHEVPDIHAARSWFAENGGEFASPIVTGVLGYPIFFVRSASLGGLLLELVEIPDAGAR